MRAQALVCGEEGNGQQALASAVIQAFQGCQVRDGGRAHKCWGEGAEGKQCRCSVCANVQVHLRVMRGLYWAARWLWFRRRGEVVLAHPR